MWVSAVHLYVEPTSLLFIYMWVSAIHLYVEPTSLLFIYMWVSAIHLHVEPTSLLFIYTCNNLRIFPFLTLEVVKFFLFIFIEAWREMLIPVVLWCLIRTGCQDTQSVFVNPSLSCFTTSAIQLYTMILF